MSDAALLNAWLETRDRLVREGLSLPGAGLSARAPGGQNFWFGLAEDAKPRWLDAREPREDGAASTHAAIYARRSDVGAIASGFGRFAAQLADLERPMPQVFDEQARHLGPMTSATRGADTFAKALTGCGAAVTLDGVTLCFGVTLHRLALNVELLEKCAKAYGLATAAGARVRPLPWWVRRIANGRYQRDARRAAEAFARGEAPVESAGY